MSYSASDGQYKLIWTSTYWLDTSVPALAREELYDLVTDPLENRNLLLGNSYPSITDLRKTLDSWKGKNITSKQIPTMKTEILKELRSLGYLQ